MKVYSTQLTLVQTPKERYLTHRHSTKTFQSEKQNDRSLTLHFSVDLLQKVYYAKTAHCVRQWII